MAKRNIKVFSDPDFVHSKRHSNSLKKLLVDNPDGVSDSTICRVLRITEEELQEIYEGAIVKLQIAFGERKNDL